MVFSEVRFNEIGWILADADGDKVCFPAVEGNKFWDEVVAQEITPADYTDPPATMQGIRNLRNQLLKDTDWQAGTDVTMTDAQKAYRQKLRDLPATNSDPTKIVFPDAP